MNVTNGNTSKGNTPNAHTTGVTSWTEKSSDEVASEEEEASISLDHDKYNILLFYLYHEISNTDDHLAFQRNLCSTLYLSGRIRISVEGLNVVLSGTIENLKEYEKRLCKDGLSQEIDVKSLDSKYCRLRKDLSASSQLFGYLSIKVTPDLVTLEDARFKSLDERSAAVHLSPSEWHEAILNSKKGDGIFIDARNIYESKVGYFASDNVPTLLTNTRRYSQLPQVLSDVAPALAGKHLYMYCTGGVRCEKLSKYMKYLIDNEEWKGEKPKGIYQLHGGIQRYLEQYGNDINESVVNEGGDSQCLFKGRNFVFDQRRIDPQVGFGTVGKCVLCHSLHSDYDNGKSPNENNESRCCRCRVLLLVCNSCRGRVLTHGESEDGERKADIMVNVKVKLFCGAEKCVNEGNVLEYDLIEN